MQSHNGGNGDVGQAESADIEETLSEGRICTVENRNGCGTDVVGNTEFKAIG